MIKKFYELEYIGFDNKTQPNNLNVLIVCSTHVLGGGEMYVINVYNNLLKKGHNPIPLVIKNAPLSKLLKEKKISHYQCNYFRKTIHGITLHPGARHVKKICKKENIDIIQCGEEGESNTARRGLKHNKPKLILVRQIPETLKPKTHRNTDGIISITQTITKDLKNKARAHKLSTKNIVTMPPLFNQEKFINFVPTTSHRDLFFRKTFNINLKPIPLVCVVANMYKDVHHKNHPLLFKAMQKLIFEQNKPFQVVLAGDGESKQYLQNLTKELRINNYVHFLGFTDKTPEVVFHSDFQIVPSSKEALGIIVIEAALLQTATIGATNTGVTGFINHKETGLLFENNNIDDLAEKIKVLLDDKTLAITLGKNAYTFVRSNFSPEITIGKYVEFYQDVINQQPFQKPHRP